MTTFPTPFDPGFHMISGEALNNALAQGLTSSQDNATATLTGVGVVANLTRFTVVPAGGIAILPKANPGSALLVLNSGANTLQINPSLTTETIDGLGTVTLSVASRGSWFYCFSAGSWRSAIIGTVST